MSVTGDEMRQDGRDVRWALRDALFELSESVPFDKMTVRQIAERAGVSVRTFYNYFVDKYDLLGWAYEASMEQGFEQVFCPEASLCDFMLWCIRSMDAKGVFSSNALRNTHGRDSFRVHIYRCNYAVYQQFFEKLFERCLTEEESFQLDLYLRGTVDKMIDWLYLSEADRCSSEHLAHLITDSAPTLVRELCTEARQTRCSAS